MDLRRTDTNGSDDAAGRVFGLDGNAYLPVVIAGLAGLAAFAVLGLGLGIPLAVAGAFAALPAIAVTAWILALRKGKPRGHDRDQLDAWLGRVHFAPQGGEGGA